MKKITILIILLSLTHTIMAQNIISIEAQPNKTVEIKGDLKDGSQLESLRWAWNSAVACFPETQREKFTGNHVLYTVTLPKYSEMEVTVIPDDTKANFSIYAYEVGQVDETTIVPNLQSCVRCEADHKWDYKYKGKTQDHSRTVKNLVAINNPYEVVIGVVGADGLDSGAYRLQVSLKTK